MNTGTVGSAKKLKIGYKGKSIHPPLNLNLYEGELVCLIGQNGCGKSTLIRTMGGLQPPVGGQIEIMGVRIDKLKPKQRAGLISFVLTDRTASDNLTVRQTVEMGRLPYTNMFGTLKPADKEICDACMAETNITHLRDRRLGEISDGERQRTLIAKALAQTTPLILLDEPCAHLDLPNKISVMCLLRKLAKNSRKSVLLSSHELDIALQVADKIWLMDKDGLQRGTPEDLILEGKIEAAFNGTNCRFEPSSGTFKINYGTGRKISVTGDGTCLRTLWTKRALSRAGFEICPDEELLSVNASEDGWILHDGSRKGKFQSIEDLLDALEHETS